MPWNSTDRDSIMSVLGIPYSDLWTRRLNWAMATVETYGSETAIERIQGYLTEYQTLGEQIQTTLGNAGFKRVDQIEWFAPGAAGVGYESQRTALRGQIAAALNLSEYLPSSGHLVRS